MPAAVAADISAAEAERYRVHVANVAQGAEGWVLTAQARQYFAQKADLQVSYPTYRLYRSYCCIMLRNMCNRLTSSCSAICICGWNHIPRCARGAHPRCDRQDTACAAKVCHNYSVRSRPALCRPSVVQRAETGSLRVNDASYCCCPSADTATYEVLCGSADCVGDV